MREIAPLVRGARIAEVLPLPPRDLLLAIVESDAERGASERPDDRGPASAKRARPRFLRFSADPSAPRLHVQHAHFARHVGPVGPFYQRAVRELVGASIQELAQVAGDRACVLETSGSPAGERRALVCELFGRRPNLVLVGADDVIVEVLDPPAASPSGEAPRLTKGARWTLARPKSSPPRAALPSAGTEPWPAIDAESPDRDLAARAPLSWIVEAMLGTQAGDARRSTAAGKLVQRLERKLARSRTRLLGMERKALESAGAERVQRDGELLKANLDRLRRGLSAVEIEDWFESDSPKRTIALDPKKSPIENLNHYFERAKKLAAAHASDVADCSLARDRIERLEAMLARAADPDEDPDELAALALKAGLLEPEQQADPRKRKAPPPRLPYRTFASARGTPIRVGRNARDNDDLTLHHARGNDLWLHTADAPGSHVVVPLERGAEPHPDDVLDAAHLALHFSPLRGSSRGDVHVARKKEVHKPRGAKPGLVTLSGGRILRVVVQPERMARLLRSAHTPGESGDAPAS